MHRLLFAAAFATGLVGSADAATKKGHHVRAGRAVAMERAPAFASANTRPAWAAPQQCFTDDGYGRFTPCEGGGKGY
jgi:hypothetical protein